MLPQRVPSESEGPDARYAMSKEKCSASNAAALVARREPSADRGVLAACVGALHAAVAPTGPHIGERTVELGMPE